MPASTQYEISTDRHRLDLALIHDFLRSSYWAKDIPRDVVEKSIQHSLCFGAYLDGEQVGFARVITDFSTVAYLADVFVLPEHRGRGISKKIMQAILAHPELQGLRRLLLATLDAHGLYAQFGFQPLAHPEHFMTVHHPDVYQADKASAHG
jgi:GNAT superfamily N-acetyltransferase